MLGHGLCRFDAGFKRGRRDARRRAPLVRSGSAARASERVAFVVAHVPPFRLPRSDVAGHSAPGRATDPATDLLNGRHQWIAEQHRPGNAEAELRAHLGVSGDAAGIVVRGTRNVSRPKNAKCSGFFGILCFVWFRQRQPSLQILNERQSEKFKDAAAHSLLGMAASAAWRLLLEAAFFAVADLLSNERATDALPPSHRLRGQLVTSGLAPSGPRFFALHRPY